jgi:hypothetical protein
MIHLDLLEDYMDELARLNGALEDAAARTDFDEAGRIFTELLTYQYQHRREAALAASMVELNRGPSRAAGLPAGLRRA